MRNTKGRARGISPSPLRLVLRDLGRSGEHPSLALVFEPETLAVDADDDRVVQDAIEHRQGEHAGAGGMRASLDNIARERLLGNGKAIAETRRAMAHQPVGEDCDRGIASGDK